MNPVLKTVINSQIRHWVMLLVGGVLLNRFGFAESTISYLRDTNLDYVTILGAAGVSIWSIYSRWNAKRKTAVALQLPEGSTPSELNEAMADKELVTAAVRAVASSKAAKTVLIALTAALLTSCAAPVAQQEQVPAPGGPVAEVPTTRSVTVQINGKPYVVREGSVISYRGKDGRYAPLTVTDP